MNSNGGEKNKIKFYEHEIQQKTAFIHCCLKS